MSCSYDGRSRVWTCEVYPSESYCKDHGLAVGYDGHSGWGNMPDNFMDIIDSWHIPALLSPCHDKDLERENADVFKKPHFHLLLKFAGKKSFGQIAKLFDEINGVYCEREASVHDERSLARYFCHLDHPYKYQYDLDDVTTFANYDYIEVIESALDIFRVQQDLQAFVQRNKSIRSYSELCDWCFENNSDWYRVLSKACTLHFTQYFKSRNFDPITSDDIKKTWE